MGGEYSALLPLNASHALLIYERGAFDTITLRTLTLPRGSSMETA